MRTLEAGGGFFISCTLAVKQNRGSGLIVIDNIS